MTYGRAEDRDLSRVFVEATLVAHSEEYADADCRVHFVFKPHDGNDIEEGPSVVCDFATTATDTTGIQIQPIAIEVAMKMLRRIASMSDEDILRTWRDSFR